MKKSQPDRHDQFSASLKVGAYNRVSTDEQASVVEGSLDNQRHRMQSFVDNKNMQEPGWGQLVEVFVDDGFSAKDTNRPAYQRLLKALLNGKINAVMVTELSRLSRNIPDFCDFHKLLDGKGAKFLSIKEQFDTSTPAGKMMLYNMINLAQFEREQISERVAVNCHSRAQRGLLNGGTFVLGYEKDPQNKTTFVVNEIEAETVRKIFFHFLEQRSLSRTIKAIEAAGLAPKIHKHKNYRLVRAGRWTVGSLNFVLQNQAYVGLREINKTVNGKDQRHLKVWQRYSVVKASRPAIVDADVFEEVQEILWHNREGERLRLDTSVSRTFAASGLCICGECGQRLLGSSAHGRNKIHRYYIHASKTGDRITCPLKRIRADQIESRLAEHLAQNLTVNGHFKSVEERIRKTVTSAPEKTKTQKILLQSELKKITLAIRNTFRIQSALEVTSEAIQTVAEELEELGRRKRELESDLEHLKNKEWEQSDVEDAIDELKDRVSAFQRGWAKASPVMKKSLMREVIHSIIVKREGLEIQYRLTAELNSEVTGLDRPTAPHEPNSVIQMSDRRPQKTDRHAGHENERFLRCHGSDIVRDGTRDRT